MMQTDITLRQASAHRRWLLVLAILATSHILLFYGLPNSIRLTAAAALGILYLRVGTVAALVTTISLALATALCALVINILGLDKAIYYRPHEQLTRQVYEHGYRAYKSNARIEMTQPHGDLKALTSVDLAHPRQVIFQTDSAGFRNDHDYQNGQYVLLGDSFVMSEGASQADILSNQLTRNYGIPAYSLGHPGDIADYLAIWNTFREQHPAPLHGVLFLFEGNDFNEDYEAAPKEKPGLFKRWFDQYGDFFSNSSLHRVTKSLYLRATKAGSISKSDKVRIVQVGSQRMGFYSPYIEVSLRKKYVFPPAMARDLKVLGRQVEHIFFIPTNYRVYARHLGLTDLPHAQWGALANTCKQHGWRCTDLTPALVAESDELLRQGEYTWWPDDTHWNRTGVAVAARIVAEQLRSFPAQ